MVTWQKVVFASDCVDCECPGPTQDDLYDYKERNGEMFAAKKR